MKLNEDPKEIKAIYKQSTNRKHFPKNILECVNLESLNFAYNAMSEFPAELVQLTKLEYINYNNNKLEALPSNLGDFPSLKRLNVSSNKIKEIPASIGNLTQLEYLDISGNQLTVIPPEIGKCKSLKHLILGNNLLTELPDELFDLENLVFLRIPQNPIKVLSPKIGQLTKLEQLYAGRMELTELPAELSKCSALRDLVIGANQLTTIPDFLTQLEALEFLSIFRNRIEGFQKSLLYFPKLSRVSVGANILPAGITERDFNDLLEFLGKKKVPKEMRYPIYEVYEGAKEDLLTTYSRAEIAAILPMNSERAFKNAKKYLKSPSLKDRPIQAGDELAMFGRAIFTRKEIKEKLEGLQAKLGSKVTKNTTHVLLGKHSKYVEGLGKEGIVFVTDVELQSYFNEVEDAYLLDATVEENGFIEQIETLMKTGDDDNVGIALQMMRGGGLPKELIPLVYINYLIGTSRTNRAEAKKLLKLYGDEKMQSAMKLKHKKFEPNKMAYFLRRKMDDNARTSGIPAWKIAEVVYKRYNRCADILLESKEVSKEKKMEILSPLYNQKRLNLQYMSLKEFPTIIYELEDIECLILSHHEFRSMPEGIGRLKNLQQLYLGFTWISSLPADFAQLENLTYLDIKHTSFSELPEVISQLPNLKRINVGGLLDRRKGFEIANLQEKLPGVIIL